MDGPVVEDTGPFCSLTAGRAAQGWLTLTPLAAPPLAKTTELLAGRLLRRNVTAAPFVPRRAWVRHPRGEAVLLV